MVDVLDEPIGDPAAINTLLMCEPPGRPGSRCFSRDGRRRALRRLPQAPRHAHGRARYLRVPGPIRSLIAPAVRGLPVAVAGRGLRTVRWAHRFLTFAELPEEEAFRRSYTLYGRDELADLLDPSLAVHVDGVMDSHRRIYEDNSLEEEVARMCLADTRMFLPGLNLAYTDRASMAASTEAVCRSSIRPSSGRHSRSPPTSGSAVASRRQR